MILSMTAFARHAHDTTRGRLVWELRSINHRYLELTTRLPEELRGLEPRVREAAGRRLARGKVECALRLEGGAIQGGGLCVNLDLARQVIEAAARVEGLLHEAVPLSTMDILSWPGVIEGRGAGLEELESVALEVLDTALHGLVETRAREGARLAETLRERVGGLREQAALVRVRLPQVLDALRQRLRERISEIAAALDDERLEQEVALAALRLDLAEEIDRLDAHLDEVEAILRRAEPVGRRLDFLMQELNREANTLGAKANDLEITRAAVTMKVLIEQMREQVQNIE
jgi:uncharacterized protein (TIGR00255 family)